MAVYSGPKGKIERRFNDSVFGSGKVLKKKNYPPGQHGKLRRKKTSYAYQLMEKQKVKHMYGLLEKQFKNLFSLAVKKKGVTGELLIQLLESRLDNIVYRLGLAPTRKAARQLVSHKHITINGLIVNIPSYKTSVGDIVGVRERSASIEIIKEKASTSFTKHAWLEWDKNVMKGKILFQPSRAEIPENIKEQSIVELYSK